MQAEANRPAVCRDLAHLLGRQEPAEGLGAHAVVGGRLGCALTRHAPGLDHVLQRARRVARHWRSPPATASVPRLV
ncbi:MAG TPA: hypothetical protein VET24_05785, partial [Actinomycetota bacterium]|nr:hypothetical protein [Actinomycetota bacterium]